LNVEVEINKIIKPKKMRIFKNCGGKLSCGCQRRKSKNGTSCCNKCVMAVNKKTARLGKLEVSAEQTFRKKK
jgi:hypothetical protein